jgi:hypothetical protein
MSIATAPAKPISGPVPATDTLLQPLARLQRGIRRYILLEGMAWLVIFTCLWAAVTFFFDWGLLFALCGVDYIRDGGPAVAWFLRSLFLGTLGVGAVILMGYHFIYRLAVTFSRDELALVLERRFPHLLGDRLLTAVQLADPEQARRYEYSWEMVQVTMKEAGERITQLSVGQVFNWSRLLQRLGLALLLVAGAGVTAFLATDYFALWAERNYLLENVYWPRAYILEVPDFAQTPVRAVPYGEEQRVTVRAWKWVVATRDNPEGWRRLEWADVLPGDRHGRPWELTPPPADPALHALLPTEWQKLCLDEVEVRMTTLNDVQRRELGLAVLHRLQEEIKHTSADGSPLLPTALQPYLPEVWQRLATPTELQQYLAATERFTPGEAKALAERLQTLQPLPSDLQRSLVFAFQPLQPPLLNQTLLERGIAADKAKVTPEMLTPAEAALLPVAWKQLPRAALIRRLQEFQTQETAEALGRRIEQKLAALFQELAARSQQSHAGSRRAFRQLFKDMTDVQVFLTFEPILEGVEQRTASKSGRQEIRRQPGTNDFVFVFKKIESAFRFRADAGRTYTPWYRVNVKPLPQLKYFRQANDEPGYLYNSNQRVRTGPHLVSMIGPEWRTEAPIGSRLVWEAESLKPLKSVQLTLENSREQIQVVHSPGSPLFAARLDKLGTQTLVMHLRMTDEDGISVHHPIRLVPVPDKEPTFDNLAFPIVNPKMITAQALLPLTVNVNDDHGLTGLYYEVIVQQMDRKIIFEGKVPFRQFQPLRLAGLTSADFHWENPADMTQAKLLTGIQGDPFYYGPLMAQLPLTGPLGMVQLPRADLRRSQSFEYQDDATYGPVLRPDQEYLDTLQIRALAQKPMDKPLITPPYRLLVRLVALDSRMQEEGRPIPAPQEGRSEQVLEFTVVDERTLMVEVGNKEEELHSQSQDIVRMLQKVRGDLDKMSKELATYKPEEFRKVADDVRLAAQTVAEQRQLTRGKVLLPFRAAYRELAVNRCQPQVLERLDRRICLPLTELISPQQPFDRAHQLLVHLAERLDAEGAKVPASDFAPSIREVDEAIRRMGDIMKEMQKLIEFNQALKVLEELIQASKQQSEKIKDREKKEKQKELDNP